MTGSGPLAGLRVVVTRAEHQAGGLAAAFEAAGARVEILPLLEIVPPADRRPLERAAAEIALYDWLVFTSANAVESFLPFLGGALPPRVQVAVVGPATAAALRTRGIEPALAATRSDAEGLVAEGLRQAGAEAVAVVAYDKRLPAEAAARARELFEDAPLGWVTFTSPRIVRHFVDLFGEDWERRRPELRAASVGPVTSAELRRQGVAPAAEAARPGDEEMVRAVAARISAPHP
jgi:uroporphyrinogen-III synthase